MGNRNGCPFFFASKALPARQFVGADVTPRVHVSQEAKRSISAQVLTAAGAMTGVYFEKSCSWGNSGRRKV
jgi:hypothetical protein